MIHPIARTVLALFVVLAASCGGESATPLPTADADAGVAVDVPRQDAPASVDLLEPGDLPSPDVAADGGGEEPVAHLLPGPGEAGWDAELAAKARRYDRCWRLWNAAEVGLNTDVSVALDNPDDRALIEDFVQQHDGWEEDFEAFAGRPAVELISGPNTVAGLYGGVGLVADAYRYGVLRDTAATTGEDDAEVDRARVHLLRGLEMLHAATAITGVEGVIARGLALTAWNERWGIELVPLADAEGDPLPEVKNNGAWRADNSPDGAFPHLIWEDSVSRDQLVGWVAAFAAAWEVVANDPDIPQAVKDTLQADAKALGRALMVVGESGYDLEVPDADGRITLHGWLNEHNLDGQAYLPQYENGFHAVMALGIVAAYAYTSGDAELTSWLEDELIGERELPRIAKERVADLTDFGYGSNFSNYNMAFMGFWLALRYIDVPAARQTLREALEESLYARPGEVFQPVDISYSFYDFTYAAGMADASAFSAGSRPDAGAVGRGTDTLVKFAEPPYWDYAVVNCPVYEGTDCGEQYSEHGFCNWPELGEVCIASDGVTELHPIGCVAWKCTEAVAEPVPWQLHRPSNYHWRSAPHQPNGGGSGAGLLPGVDFRFAYWLGRWTRVAP